MTKLGRQFVYLSLKNGFVTITHDFFKTKQNSPSLTLLLKTSIHGRHCVYISELVYNTNELLNTTQTVCHPGQDIGEVRNVAFFYFLQLNIYFCMFANVFTRWPSQNDKGSVSFNFTFPFQIPFPTILPLMKTQKSKFF